MVEKVTHIMRVLIVTRYFWPEDGVAEEPLMLRDYAKWHTKKGHNVEVVTGARKGQPEDWKSEFNGTININYFFANIDRKSTYLKRIIYSLLLLVISLKSIFLNKKYDLIYVFSGPPLIAFLIGVTNKILLKRSRIIFSVQDNIIYRINNEYLKKAFKIYMKCTVFISDIVLVLSTAMKDEIVSYFNLDKSEAISKKIYILMNFCSDLDNNNSIEDKKYKSIDIIYAGNHGPSQGLSKFIDIISQIKNKDRPKIYFYGEGSEKDELIRYAGQLDVQIKFNKTISRRDIKSVISKSRYGLVCMAEPLSKFAFPSKLAAYLSVGTRTIICSNGNDEIGNYIIENNFGYFIDSSNPKNAATLLNKYLSKDEDLPIDFAENVEYQFSKNEYFKKLEKILAIR